MAWFHFWDMHSGGGQKLDWAHIFIEADSQDAAISVFYSKFNRNPERVTCTCCGEDYSISKSSTLAEATAYHRDCRWMDGQYEEKAEPGGRYISLEDFIKRPEIKVIWADEIQPGEMTAYVPDEGYVWR